MKSPEQNTLSKTETAEAPFKQTLYKTGFESIPVLSKVRTRADLLVSLSTLQSVNGYRTQPKTSTRMLFIAGQCLQGSHSQLSITVNSFLSHTGCFALLIRSEMRWFQRSHCFLYEGSAGLTNRNCKCASLQCFVLKRIQVSGCTKCVSHTCTCVCRCGCRWIPQNKTRTCYLSGVFVYVCVCVFQIFIQPPVEISGACRGVSVPTSTRWSWADSAHCSVTWIWKRILGSLRRS